MKTDQPQSSPGVRLPETTLAGNQAVAFRDHLRRNGLKLTREREQILEEVYRIEGHFRPEDLLVRFRTNGLRISRATIYRTLDLLIASGLVHRETFRGGGAHYERVHTVHGHFHHDHLYCTGCGAIFEFHNEEIEALQNLICASFDFEPQSHSHQIWGLCKSCRRRTGAS
ncbi:MAG: Fur family transcriptional regulator [Acidobacteriota bacterium]